MFGSLNIKLRALCRSFGRDTGGFVVVVTALVLPILFSIVAVAIDYSIFFQKQKLLQHAADAGAIAGAKQLSLTNASNANVDATIKTSVDAYVEQNADGFGKGGMKVESRVSADKTQITVDVTGRIDLMFGNPFGLDLNKASVSATAIVVGQPNICVLGLNTSDGGVITLEKTSKISGKGCAIFSNSTHGDSIKSKENSRISAQHICSGGGFEGSKGNYDPVPLTDCPYFDDPMSSRSEPASTDCTFKSKTVVESSRQLDPGVYCEGLEIKGNATVQLNPGTYVMKDGSLIVADAAELRGKGVTIFFTGNGADLLFDRDTTISIEAPDNGPMAGILMFSSRRMARETYKILSNNARVLLGTVYLPNGLLLIETETALADQSAYTAIVADTIHLIGEPHLVLNTDYDATTVPVPAGIRGVGQPVRLSK